MSGNFQFISNRNYMKKDPSSGTGTIAGPSVSYFFGNYYKTIRTIPHNLNYTPLFRVYYEPFLDGKVMEAFQDTNGSLPNPPNGVRITNDGPTLLAWADSTNLYIELNFIDASLAGNNYPIYWTIYKDFGLSA